MFLLSMCLCLIVTRTFSIQVGEPPKQIVKCDQQNSMLYYFMTLIMLSHFQTMSKLCMLSWIRSDQNSFHQSWPYIEMNLHLFSLNTIRCGSAIVYLG